MPNSSPFHFILVSTRSAVGAAVSVEKTESLERFPQSRDQSSVSEPANEEGNAEAFLSEAGGGNFEEERHRKGSPLKGRRPRWCLL